MSFRNRIEAGRELAVALAGYMDQQAVVLALPRGGVVVAAEVATALAAPLDLILVRKVGVPFQSELAMGAVVDGGASIVVRNEDVSGTPASRRRILPPPAAQSSPRSNGGANCIWAVANAPKSVDALRL